MVGMGERLRKLRKEHRLTQRELGNRVGLRDNSISLFESDSREPSASMLVRLASELHTTPDYLLGVDKQQFIVIDQMDEPDREALVMLAASLIEKHQARQDKS